MNSPTYDEVVETKAAPAVTLDRARRFFLESIHATKTNDELCKRDARYYHGDQISATTRATLNERGQPPVVVNRIKPAIDGVFGIVDTAESAPECFPRNVEDQNAADTGTKLLRYLGDKSDMHGVRRRASEDFFTYGTCAAIVGESAKAGDSSISVTSILWEDFFYDPLARAADFSDAGYMGIAQWLDVEQVKALYPEADLSSTYDSGTDFLDSKNDEDLLDIWIDSSRRRMRVVELYFRDDTGDWYRVCFCQSGILEQGKSVYVDDVGRSICPIVASSFAVNRQTRDRYSAIRNAIPLQDEINSRRSKLLQVTNNRQVRQVDDGIDPKSTKIAQEQAAKADGVIPLGFDTVSTGDVFQGNVLLLQQTQQDFDRLFPTPAVLSRFGSGDSGRARQIMQQAGYTEWSRALGRLETFELQIYRRLFFAARQFMTAPTMVRITDETRAPQFVMVNKPITQPMPSPRINLTTGQPIVNPYTGQPEMDIIETVVGMENEVAKMDLDIILETVTDTTTLEQEAMAEILRYAASTGVSVLDPNFKMLLMLSPLPDKTKTIERWEATRKQMQEEVAQVQQMQAEQMQKAQQLQELETTAQAQKATAQARKANADATATEAQLNLQMQQQAFLNSLQPPSAF